jgi:hypothetical protein|eukprot:Tamp_29593.p1 GENE.Tamp_29593~~Tamp_29593.p1  ORF type:complete len:136 (-),score=13.03 Tamp_29593:134-541(-)
MSESSCPEQAARPPASAGRDSNSGCDVQAASDQPVLEDFLLEHRGDSGLSEAATECGGRTTPSGPEQPTTPAPEHSRDLGLSEAATERSVTRTPPVRRVSVVVVCDMFLEQFHVEKRLREVGRPQRQMKLQSPFH